MTHVLRSDIILHMKYTQEQKKLIKVAKEKIQELSKQQDTLYKNLLKDLNCEGECENLGLFDHIFNDFDLNKNFT